MKLSRRFKLILFATLLTLYTSGVLTWVMTHWFQQNSGFGPEPSPLRTFWLQMHAIVGLWFLPLFGYLFHSHIRPAWRRRRKLKSGTALTAVLIFLCATIPGLYYMSDEAAKNWVALSHTYVGLLALVFFLKHYLD